MGRKGKKGQTEGGQSSPSSSQSSPASKGGKSALEDSPPHADLPKDKAPKKQAKASRHELEKTKLQTNGRDSSDDAKKPNPKQKGKPPKGGHAAKPPKASKTGCCCTCMIALSVLVAVVAVAGFAAYTAYPAEGEWAIGELDAHLKVAVRGVSEFVNTNLEKILNAADVKKDEGDVEDIPVNSRDEEAEQKEEIEEEEREEQEEEREEERVIHRRHAEPVEEFEKSSSPEVSASPDADAQEEEAGDQIGDEPDVEREEVFVDEIVHDVEQDFDEPTVEDEAPTQLKEEEQEESEADSDSDVRHWETAEEERLDEESAAKEEEEEAPLDHSETEADAQQRQDAVEENLADETEVSDTEVFEELDIKHHAVQHEEVQTENVAKPEVAHEEAQDVPQPEEPVQRVHVLDEEQSKPELPTNEIPAQELPTEEKAVPAPEVPAPEVPQQEVPVPEVPQQEVPVPEVPQQKVPAAEFSAQMSQQEKVRSDEKLTLEEPSEDNVPEHSLGADEGAGKQVPQEDLIADHQPEQEVKEMHQDSAKTDEETRGDAPLHHGSDAPVEAVEQEELPVPESEGVDSEVQDSQPQEEPAQSESPGVEANKDDELTEDRLDTEIDGVDAIVTSNPDEAIESYDRILSVFPENPRAIIGKARALGVLADLKQNDATLEQSISEYLKVFSLPSVPKFLMVLAARECAVRQTARGWGNEAAQTLRSLVSLFPEDLDLYNELGHKYLLNGAFEDARATFQQILSKDPNDAFAQLYLGYIMKLVDRDLGRSLDYMKRGLAVIPVNDLKFYIELGDSLTKVNRHNEAHEVYQLAVDRNLLKSAWQRSWYNVDGLTAWPWWRAEQTHNSIDLQVLEDFWMIIRDEAMDVLVNKSSLFHQDSRDIIENGQLKHLKLFVNGHKIGENCEAAKKTCRYLDAFSNAIGCTQCEVKFSVMSPGLHILPHCGPTNCRIAAQLPLVADPGTKFRVGADTKTYTSGRFLIFDDSFEQELWVVGNENHLVLTVEMWHPDLSDELKSTIGPL